MKTFTIAAVVVLALCSMASGGQTLTVNGQQVETITLKVGQSWIVEVSSDDTSTYNAYVGFDYGTVLGSILGAFTHYNTRPAAGKLADESRYSSSADDFEGYSITADGEPAAGVHFIFIYTPEQVGQAELKLYDDVPGSVIDSIVITVVAAEMGTAFTYQGRLIDAENAADGLYDFNFKLYDSPSDGVQLAPPTGINDVNVIDGYFTVELDFGSAAFDGDGVWIETSVRRAGLPYPNLYTSLSPRQRITPAPYALYAKTAGPDGDWTINGNNMYPDAAVTGNVGIGTTNPLAKLSVGGDGFAGAGVYGSGSTYGVYGNSTSVGVWGYGAFGVFGSGSTYGVYGIDSDTNAYGRLGYDDWGGYFDGDGYFSGNVGIGTKTLDAKLAIASASSGTTLGIGRASGEPSIAARSDASGGWLIMDSTGSGKTGVNYYDDGDVLLANGGGNVGVGTTGPSQKLHVAGTIYSSSGGYRFPDNTVQTTAASAGVHYWESSGDSIRNTNPAYVGIGVLFPTSKLTVGGDIRVSTANGRVITPVLEITGGSDLSEQFDIRPDKEGGVLSPGMIVSIDAENPGKLVVSSEAYDRKVAGIISGAGGIKPGMLMGQKNSIANGASPVALTGRVYCLADASQGAIQPGDLLTTSDIPGHAMKAADYIRAQGAILGKAMTSLENGRGQILVLVTLQ